MKERSAITAAILTQLFILTSLASSSPIAPGMFGNLSVIMISTLILVFYFKNNRESKFPKIFIFLMTLIYLSIILSFLFSYEVEGYFSILDIGYPVGFILVSFVSIFIIPKIVSISQFVYFFNRLVVILIIIGVPEIILGQAILPYGREPYAPINAIYDIGYKALTSIFNDSNAMGKLTLFALLTSIIEYKIRKNKYSFILFVVILIGLILTDSRGALISVSVGITIYFVLVLGNIALSRATFIFTIIGSFIFILIISLEIPFMSDLFDLRLSARDTAWRAGINGIINQPWIGVPINHLRSEYLLSLGGLSGPQNSYLRVFLISGLVGGISYIYFILHVCYISVLNYDDGLTSALPIPIAIIMLFESFSLLGTNINSVIAGILIGYVIRHYYATDIV